MAIIPPFKSTNRTTGTSAVPPVRIFRAFDTRIDLRSTSKLPSVISSLGHYAVLTQKILVLS